MAIKTCPECGAKVENSLTCPDCGFSFKRKVNMENVNAALDAIRRYDKKPKFFLLLFIPALVFLALALFVKPIFFVVTVIFPIVIVILQTTKTLNRQKFILSVCKDKYSILSFIKEQSENLTSVTQDNSKLMALICAAAFTCEENPSAKQALKKFAVAKAFPAPWIFLLLVFISIFSLGTCGHINLSIQFKGGSVSLPFFFFALSVVCVVCIVLFIVSNSLQKKYDQLLTSYVNDWLKKILNNIEAMEEDVLESTPIQSNQSTNTQSSSEDEFDLSNLDLGDL